MKKLYASIIDQLLTDFPLPNEAMMHSGFYKLFLTNLEEVIDLPGDVVELGCNMGVTSLYIRRYLDAIHSRKKIHVYDSFMGLPPPSSMDIPPIWNVIRQGTYCVDRNSLITLFRNAKLELPIINEGWFSEIPDNKYPNEICFAFFDGDLYGSIMDSFNKVYHKMVIGGKILVHDYEGNPGLPGVKMACDNFLKNKPHREDNLSIERTLIVTILNNPRRRLIFPIKNRMLLSNSYVGYYIKNPSNLSKHNKSNTVLRQR